MPARLSLILILLSWIALAFGGVPALPFVVQYDLGAPELRFAASEIRAASMSAGHSLVELDSAQSPRDSNALRIVLVSNMQKGRALAESMGFNAPKQSMPQAYAIRVQRAPQQTTLVVLGSDPVGAMYGGLDLAESLRLGTIDKVQDSDHVPFVLRRGIKFNIPLDARTPSYSDCGDAAQQNIPEMWSFEFWREFLDEMARQRFNVLTLWNLHPFPSLVRVPEYPDVALTDVKRTTMALDDTFSHTGNDMVRPAMLKNLEVVKKMSIEEKVQFWRDVMQYAHERGIEVYLFTWNIFVWGAEGKYGITVAQTNRSTLDYFRASVRETILTYPLLAGFGITAGEQMQERKDQFTKEKWLWQAYGEGIRDAKKLQPDRNIRLIHRFHMTGQREILNEWKDYPGTFEFSFKYSIAHMYSAPSPPFIKSVLPQLSPGLKTWLTVRNDDLYMFRWGDPGYARAYLRAMPQPEKLAGYYMGPDGYIWGREFISTEPENPRQLVMKKQWYSFMLWGRLSYEPDLSDDLFKLTLSNRFPGIATEKLFATWAEASKIIPQITRFFWGDIDLKWYPEACLSHPRHKGFYTVKHFVEGSTMPESGILNISSYCQKVITQQQIDAITPPQVAEALRQHARTTLEGVQVLRDAVKARPVAAADSAKELRLTLGDLEAMSYLGNYYAEKILGATDLALFDRTGKTENKSSAVNHLEAALEHWKKYAAVATGQYRPQLLNRVGQVDLKALITNVERDVDIAKNWTTSASSR